MTEERGPDPRQSPSEEEAKALASSTRIRILRLCLREQLTNKEIATRLGANPATVLFHVRKLVATGFLEAQQARSGPSGAYEVPYLATGKMARLNLDTRDMGLRGAMVSAFVSEVGQVPESAEVAMSRRGVRLTKAAHDRFLDRVTELLDEFSAGDPGESGEGGEPGESGESGEAGEAGTRYSIFLAVHPEAAAGNPEGKSGDSADSTTETGSSTNTTDSNNTNTDSSNRDTDSNTGPNTGI